MRIHHDADRCASTGICEAIAPAVFSVAADGALRVLNPTPPSGSRELVADAVAACPTAALRLTG